jgi:SAP domain
LKPAGDSDDRSTGGRLIVSGGRREYIPNQEYQQKSQATQPKQAAKRDTTPYTASRSKSNDWFDESSSYDSFGSDSAAGSSRSTRSSGGVDVNPQVEADRLDSERILNELLMDLDTGESLRGSSSSSDREVDYFDFSMDSEDLKSSAKPPASRQQTSANSRIPSKPAGGRNSAPQMEDFVSFELYLDALVSHERSAIGGGNNYMDGASNKKSPSFNSRSSGDDSRGSSSNRDFDALDDNLVAFLGGEDEDDSGSKGSSRGSQQNSRSSRDSSSDRRVEDSKPVRSWSPKATVAVAEDLAPVDDLSRFLDSLEESNVLPSKGKTPVKAEKEKEVKAAPIAQSTAAPAASSDYSRLSLKDLKDKLRERGLPVSGNKAELVTRLSA